MNPHLEILPEAQKWLWPQLAEMEEGFVLYGGTAIALRFAHRQSVDFDFFGTAKFDPLQFREKHRFLSETKVIQMEANTLTLHAPTPYGVVNVSIFGGLAMGRAGTPDVCPGNGVRLASPLDLAVQKLKVIQVRSEAKDYIDLDCLLDNGVILEEAIGAAESLYPGFPSLWALKALCYHEDGNISTIDNGIKARLKERAIQFKGPVQMPRISEALN